MVDNTTGKEDAIQSHAGRYLCSGNTLHNVPRGRFISIRRNMKAAAISFLAAVLYCGVNVHAQANTPPSTPPAPAQSMAKPTAPPPPAPAPIPVEAKHSEATANLELAEQKKLNLQMQQQFLINNANAQISKIREQLQAQEKSAAEAQAEVKKENGWGDNVVYVSPQQLPDGSTAPGRWQKAITPNK